MPIQPMPAHELIALARAEADRARQHLRFTGRLEGLARDHRLQQVLPQLRTVFTVAIGGVLAFVVFYIWNLQGPALQHVLVAAALAVLAAALVLVAARRADLTSGVLEKVAAGGALVFGLAISYSLQVAREAGVPLTGAAVPVYVIAAHLLLGLRLWVTLTLTLMVSLVHLAWLAGGPLFTAAGLVEAMFIALAHVVGFSAALDVERLWRREFLQRILLTADAERDGLTGLYNHRMGEALLKRSWDDAARNDKPLILCMVDLDHFKAYNDRYGHLDGDDCLRRVTQVLGQMGRRPLDVAARWGGEEFLLVCHDVTAPFAEQLGEHIRRRVARLALPHAASPVADLVTVSVGVVICRPARGSTPTSALEAADTALYAAKAAGRDRAVVSRLDA